MSEPIALEDPVSMCATFDNVYWAHGWIDKRKFRGHLLSRADSGRLEGEEDARDIIAGKVHHGWVISIVGDTSGCGWDLTTYFETEEPHPVDGRWIDRLVLDEDEDGVEVEVPAEVADGPHKATWWSP